MRFCGCHRHTHLPTQRPPHPRSRCATSALQPLELRRVVGYSDPNSDRRTGHAGSDDRRRMQPLSVTTRSARWKSASTQRCAVGGSALGARGKKSPTLRSARFTWPAARCMRRAECSLLDGYGDFVVDAGTATSTAGRGYRGGLADRFISAPRYEIGRAGPAATAVGGVTAELQYRDGSLRGPIPVRRCRRLVWAACPSSISTA